MRLKLNSLFLSSLFFLCIWFVIWDHLRRNISWGTPWLFENLVFLTTSTKFWKYFIMFTIFLRTHTPVKNLSLLERESWYFGKLKLQYDLKTLNVTKLVTQMQSRGGGPFQKHCSSVLLFKQEDLCSTSYYGNARWTVNLVPARELVEQEPDPHIFFQKFKNLNCFQKNSQNWHFREKFHADRTLRLHWHFVI